MFVKLLTTLVMASMVTLGVYMARRRIIYALKTGATAYVVILFGRLLLSAGSLADRWEDLVWPTFFILLAWLVLWSVNTTLDRARRPRS